MKNLAIATLALFRRLQPAHPLPPALAGGPGQAHNMEPASAGLARLQPSDPGSWLNPALHRQGPVLHQLKLVAKEVPAEAGKRPHQESSRASRSIAIFGAWCFLLLVAGCFPSKLLEPPGRPIPPAEVVAKIDAVTLDDVARLAGRLFKSKPSLTALGPIAQVMEYDALAGRLS